MSLYIILLFNFSLFFRFSDVHMVGARNCSLALVFVRARDTNALVEQQNERKRENRKTDSNNNNNSTHNNFDSLMSYMHVYLFCLLLPLFVNVNFSGVRLNELPTTIWHLVVYSLCLSLPIFLSLFLSPYTV